MLHPEYMRFCARSNNERNKFPTLEIIINLGECYLSGCMFLYELIT